MAKSQYFIGVDIGGTFTDVVLAEAVTHRLFTAKTLTTPGRPGEAVISAIRDALAQAKAIPADVQRVVHATTLATNLILERKGSEVAYVTTKGFGDLFVIGKERVVGADRYNLFFEKSPPLVSRSLTLEVEERINNLGEVVEAFNEQSAVEGLKRLARENPQAVAICFFHSYANPKHEQWMAELVRKHMPRGLHRAFIRDLAGVSRVRTGVHHGNVRVCRPDNLELCGSTRRRSCARWALAARLTSCSPTAV